jgi:SAM-dependent methyltransferase
MDADYHRLIAEVEDEHWWFAGRRKILAAVIETLDLPRGTRILDVGCGSGGNLTTLARFGQLSAMEIDGRAREIASGRGVCEVVPGSLPGTIPFGPASFDVVTALDVIEHIEDDRSALEAIHGMLVPGGRLVITVPAYRFLWSYHDVVNCHFRRYSRRDLSDALRSARLEPVRISYFNTWLFPFAALVRLAGRFVSRRGAGPDMRLPPPRVNRLLTSIFSSEAHVLRRRSLPFGVSVLAVAVACS